MVLSMVLATHPLSSQPEAGSQAHIPGTVCTQLAGSRVGYKAHLLNIKDMCSDHSLLLLISVEQTQSQAPLKPSPQAEVTSKIFREQVLDLLFFPFISPFFSF